MTSKQLIVLLNKYLTLLKSAIDLIAHELPKECKIGSEIVKITLGGINIGENIPILLCLYALEKIIEEDIKFLKSDNIKE